MNGPVAVTVGQATPAWPTPMTTPEREEFYAPPPKHMTQGIVQLPCPIAQGPWRIERFDVQEPSWRPDPRACPPGHYTRLLHEKRGVLMSDTPAELNDFVYKGGAWQYKGRVLIHGLGIGMCLRYLLDKRPQVTHIDVVELDPDILAMVAPHYADPRVTFHQGDALTFRFPKGTTWDFAWHDIWYSNDESENEQRSLLNRRYGRAVARQYTWGRMNGRNW